MTFPCMKSDVGLRPVNHQIERRTDAEIRQIRRKPEVVEEHLALFLPEHFHPSHV